MSRNPVPTAVSTLPWAACIAAGPASAIGRKAQMRSIARGCGAIATQMAHATSSDMPNEPEADPLLQGIFIGDYIEVAAFNGTAYIGYNMNVRSIQFLFTGESVHQQDNYLSSATE